MASPDRVYRNPWRTRRQFLGLLGSASVALAAGACLGSDDPEVRLTVDGGNPPPPPVPGASGPPGATPTAVPFAPTAPPSDLDPDDLHGFVMPIEGACLPSNEWLMANAPLESREGVHEGVDFYWGDSCVLIERGTPVVAAHAGVVLRADHDYVPLTFDEAASLARQVEEDGDANDETLDRYRGRQVWIDHGNGVVTRYCQLSTVASEIAEGVRVEQGAAVGAVGESGLPRALTAPGTDLHLHWEVRVGDTFLGAGLEPDAVRALYQRLTQPRADG